MPSANTAISLFRMLPVIQLISAPPGLRAPFVDGSSVAHANSAEMRSMSILVLHILFSGRKSVNKCHTCSWIPVTVQYVTHAEDRSADGSGPAGRRDGAQERFEHLAELRLLEIQPHRG